GVEALGGGAGALHLDGGAAVDEGGDEQAAGGEEGPAAQGGGGGGDGGLAAGGQDVAAGLAVGAQVQVSFGEQPFRQPTQPGNTRLHHTRTTPTVLRVYALAWRQTASRFTFH